MPSPSEIKDISNSPLALHCPSPWPSTSQHLCLHLYLHLLFHQNYPPTIQYNWLESETQCALMHSVLNSLRDHLWFNQLKGFWNLVLKWNTLTHIPLFPSLLPPLLPEHHPPHISTPTFTSVKRNSVLSSFSCIFHFLFNAVLSEFDSQYYNIMYIHSLLLNSEPWTETIKTSTFNFKHKLNKFKAKQVRSA